MKRGHLTVLLGFLPNAGQHSAMLEFAREKTAGCDDYAVVIWVAEGTFRPAYDGFLDIPNSFSICDGNISEVVAKKPTLVCAGDLCRPSVSGIRKRYVYQDALELLDSGVDVCATASILNFESLIDTIVQITGYLPSHVVPDRVVEAADQVILVDASVELLIQRANTGRVPKELPCLLFRAGNINALRVMALSWMIEHVDARLRRYVSEHLIPGPWLTRERLLVVIGPNALSLNLVRVGSRLARVMQAPWLVATIETHQGKGATTESKVLVDEAIKVAEDLGAEVISVSAPSVYEGISQVASEKNITQVIIGYHMRSGIKRLVRIPLVDKILEMNKGLSVYVVPEGNRAKTRIFQSKLSMLMSTPPAIMMSNILPSIMMTAVLTLLLLPLRPILDPVNMALFYLIPVLVSATRRGEASAITAAFMGVLAFDVFFIPPVHHITVQDARYLLTFVIFLLVALTTGRLASSLRKQVEISRIRHSETLILQTVSRELAAAYGLSAVLDVIVSHITDLFKRPCMILLLESSGNLEEKVKTSSAHDLGIAERQVADWVVKHGAIAGMGTDTLPSAAGQYYPLKTHNGIIGVFVIYPRGREEGRDSSRQKLLVSLASLGAMAIERAKLAEESEESRWVKESERLYSSIFNSVSHELKTPLATILAAATSLQDPDIEKNEGLRHELMDTVVDSGIRMDRLVSNLLDMARLESGRIRLVVSPTDINELVEITVEKMGALHRGGQKSHPVNLSLTEKLPLVCVDVVLIEQVLANLIDNAIKYSPVHSPISIKTSHIDDKVLIEVSDMGPGVPINELALVFEKFYRVQDNRSNRGGTGLGLSICKGIVEAHGGRIWAENRKETGLSITMSLEIEKAWG